MDFVWDNMRGKYKCESGSPRMLFRKHELWSMNPNLTHMCWYLFGEHVVGPLLSGLDNLVGCGRNGFCTTAEIRYQCHYSCQIWLLLCCIVIMSFSFLPFLTFHDYRICDFSTILLFNMAEYSVLFHCFLLMLLHLGVWDKLFWLFPVIVRT